MHFVAVHARHVEAAPPTRFVEHAVVACAFRAEAEVVADQHVARAEPAHQHVADECFGGEAGKGRIEAQHDRLVDAAALELGELVAQRRDARGRGLGLARALREPVARIRLERHHARWQAAMRGLGHEQREHRLVPAVHAVEVSDREGAGGGDSGVVEAAKHLHAAIIGGGSAARPSHPR